MSFIFNFILFLISSFHNFIRAHFFNFSSPESKRENNKKFNPISVNYHFTRKCNYECGFCFHTSKTSHIATLEDAKEGLKKMKEAGMKKLNLSGGEPFLYPDFVGEIAKFSKETLELESFSIVSNGSKIRKEFFRIYGEFVDILAISVDSFDEDTNKNIGRGKGKHLEKLKSISKWCSEYNIKFKINSVINRYNVDEDFSSNISLLAPFRWKCFQVLAVDTENKGENAIRNCEEFLISDEEFDDFCKRHEHIESFVPESNRMMKSSYLILDEFLRFLNKGDIYDTSKSILEVSVEAALAETDWEPDIFERRGGVYDWSRTDQGCSNLENNLDF